MRSVLSNGLSGDATQRTKLPPLISVPIPELGLLTPPTGEVAELVGETLSLCSAIQCKFNEFVLTKFCSRTGEVEAALMQKSGLKQQQRQGSRKTCALGLLLGLNLEVGYVTVYVKLLYDTENVKDSSGLALIPFFFKYIFY